MPSRSELTEGPIGRRLLQLALPVLLSYVVESLSASVNSIWVGHFLGEAALAATANANMAIFVLVGSAFGVAMATSVVVAQEIGAGNAMAVKRVVGTSVTFTAAVSIATTLLGVFFSEPLLVALSTPADSLHLAVTYMKVIFLALPFLNIYNLVTSVLLGAGESKPTLYCSLLSVAIDVVLNPLFIFGAGPIPRLGVAGSALATVVAQASALTVLLFHLYKRRYPFAVYRNEVAMLRVNLRIVASLLQKGVPLGSQMFIFSFSGILMMALVNSFGVDTAAAFGASLQLWNYTVMPASALAAGLSAMVAQNVGANRWDRVSAAARTAVLWGTSLTVGIVILLELLGPHIYRFFVPAGSLAVPIGVHISRIASPSFVLFGISIMLFGVVRAAGAAVLPLLVMAVELFAVRFLFAIGLIGRLHADAVWWSFPISSTIGAILTCIYYKHGSWRSGHQRGRNRGSETTRWYRDYRRSRRTNFRLRP